MQTKTILLVAGLSLFTAACSRTAVVEAPPPDTTPVAAAPKPAPPPAAPKQQAAAPAKPAAPKPAPAKMDEQTRTALNELLAQLSDALFDYDRAEIRTDASAVLRENVAVVRNIMSEYPAEKILIEGHADERGSSEYNLALGDRRARAVHEFLTGLGIPDSQLTILSYGEERPTCADETENCWQRNRRAHLTVAP